jgi:predicted nuclease of predicted toxin-antitoxin system
MRLYADENVPKSYVRRLRGEGYDVLYVIERRRSLRDLTIIRDAYNQGAIVLTHDSDFRRRIMIEGQPSVGAIWIRLFEMPRHLREERLVGAIRAHQDILCPTPSRRSTPTVSSKSNSLHVHRPGLANAKRNQ